MFWFRIIIQTLTPVLFANIFYLLNAKTSFGKWSEAVKQIIIGVVFGAIACAATQFGVPYEGYVLNVRSAAPLIAGLVFGGPAGIIAGTIGALFRWFSVYWGIPAYTRIACSVATFLAGVIAALCRKYMFDRKKTSWFYGAFIAIANEVFHMLLVFITHPDDIARAFEVVRRTAVTMITANCISVLLALLFVALVSREGRKKLARPMTQIFAVYLFVSIFVAFIATSNFTYYLQNNVADLQVNELLDMNVGDVEADIADALDRDLLERTRRITDSVNGHSFITDGNDKEELRTLLRTLMNQEKVSEINIVGKDGKIAVSTNEKYDGFDMTGNPDGQARKFMCLLEGETSYVQDYQPMDYDSSVWRKYAGINLNSDYYVQVGYDKEDYEKNMQELFKNIATNRHIGQTGFIFVLDPASDTPVVSAPKDTVSDDSVRDFVSQITSLEDEKVLSYNAPDGEAYYYMKDTVEGYIVIGCLPTSEALFARDISVYISAFMQLVVFFVLFLLVFFLLKKIIVDNIHKINGALAKITDGNLDTRVDIRDNEEFASLSSDINTTVSRLRQYIDEAEKRIDKELAFAKSIQLSAIPSVFPPFPNRTEFDIYASMDTAKEVGGDFYDFYLLGRNHLVFLIADVSGKGIPAAMFMMTAKTMIKSYAESGLSVSEVFTRANEKLCETNEAGMFVTAWMGILNLKTGTVKFANAGHNPPVIRHGDGSFEYFKSRPGLVLAGMEGISYKEAEFKLEPGDEIFLYTDGVTEATDKDGNLYGEDRLLSALNENSSLDSTGLCDAVKKSVDGFVGEEPQFDDITMLSLKFKKYALAEGEKQ